MKKSVYIRCPRCELNFIIKKDKFCNVCKQEMKALGTMGVDENMDLDLCPVCKVNYISPDEDMCAPCAREKALEEGLYNEVDNSDDWKSKEDDGIYSEDEETGDMATITDLDEDDLDDEPLNVDLDDDMDLDDDVKDSGDLFDEDLDDDAFSDFDDDMETDEAGEDD